jgi:ribosomal protein L29
MATKRKQMMDELNKLDMEQLKLRSTELRRKLLELRTQRATDKVSDVSQFKKNRREVARIETLIRKQALAGVAKSK